MTDAEALDAFDLVARREGILPALGHGIFLEHVFGIAKQASSGITMPILAMASYSLVFRRGIDRFVGDALACGLAGFVVPDLPIEESDDLDAACRDAGLPLVRRVTPTTPPEQAAKIAAKSTGFLSCVSVAGVTGARTDLPPGLIDRVQWLGTQTDVPILVGFGISSPDQVRAVCQVADGAIVGSAGAAGGRACRRRPCPTRGRRRAFCS